MSNHDIITGIDLGSGAIRFAVGQVHERGELRIIGLAEGVSEGINKGVITNIEDTVSSISACVEEAEKLISTPIEHAYIGISGSHIISQESRGVVAISKADGEIKSEDVERVLQASKTVATPANYEILHILPRSFSVDNQPGIMDPVGMTGVRLEVDAQIILGLSNQIKNLTRAFYRVGIGIDDLVFTVLSTSKAVLDKRQKELGVLVVNLGSTTTSIAVFEEGDVLTAKVLPIGSRHITSDIAIGLRVPMKVAEAIKLNYGTSLPSKVAKSDQINFEDVDEKEQGTASRKEVAKIIEARCEEIFKLVDNELKKIERSGKLPAGAVLTGAGSKLEGLVETAKDVLRIPASAGAPQGFVSGINKAFDTSFSTAVGLVLWGEKPLAVKSRLSSVTSMGSKVKTWFKNLLPY
ncbi:cell division protein FtsA [Patescibacteria group bacterium AH-259-L07]|nr:cell division protein FtsA [Patescibacteria group bacterium AH-259-L07]